jgi:hypothetical protein
MIIVLVFVVVGLVALPVHAADMRANNGRDSITLTDRPCSNPEVVKRLRPEVVDQFHAARARIGNDDFAGCWIEYGEDAFVMYEDGDKGLVPLSEFKPDGA